MSKWVKAFFALKRDAAARRRLGSFDEHPESFIVKDAGSASVLSVWSELLRLPSLTGAACKRGS
jgi:hypothetical protein